MFAKRSKNRTNVTTRSSGRAAPAEPLALAGPEYYTGQTIMPEEGAGQRIDSAADVDPNVKAYGLAGVFQGGGGGYGGAGTK